jgi:hypothetical protein
MVVGSFASTTYGEARMTNDIDIVVDLTEADVPGFLAGFPEPEFYVNPDAVREAVRQRFQFNILQTTTGSKIDVILSRNDVWGQSQMARRRRVLLLPDREGFAAAPEDVILGKLWYYNEGRSDKHLRDIAGILRLSGDQVDRADIDMWAKKLGLEEAWAAVLQGEGAK